MKVNWTDAPGIAGVGLVVAGVAHFSHAIAMIVLGAIGVLFSYKFGK